MSNIRTGEHRGSKTGPPAAQHYRNRTQRTLRKPDDRHNNFR
ncbi:hypothetical protein YT1_3462 [Rhodococcus ruber]|nr:hypothetical protein YT1_3462 [Rhodococcus ruber]